MKTRIHVNKHVIRSNAKSGEREPPITIKTYRDNVRAHGASIVVGGEVVARVIYSPDKPLSCGATVWIETDAEVWPVVIVDTRD